MPATDPTTLERFHVQGLVGQAACFVRQVNKIPLFASADARLYDAKSSGRNRVVGRAQAAADRGSADDPRSVPGLA